MSQRDPVNSVIQSSTYLGAIVLLLIVFLAAGVIYMLPQPNDLDFNHELAAELQRNRSAWEKHRPAAYQYTVRRTCFCVSDYIKPYTATEEYGHRTANFPIPIESRSGEFTSDPPDPVWIDELFDIAERSISEGHRTDLKFDSRYGYLVDLYVHPGIVDSDTKYEVRDFQVLRHQNK